LEDSGLFPPIACVLIDVGEESGKLAEALDRVAKHFAEEAKERIAALIAVINPVMTLLVVGGVGVIMLSFFQAVYQVVYATH
jgi:general secretion pathway protein F